MMLKQQKMLKDLFSETIQEILESELYEHLGYDRYDNQNKRTTNSRNGYISYNRMLKKVTKSKSVFPSDDSLHKSLYLATMDISDKYTQLL